MKERPLAAGSPGATSAGAASRPASPGATPPRAVTVVAVTVGAVALVAVAVVAAVATPAPHTGGDNAGYLSLAASLVSGDGYVEAWDPARPPHTKYPPVFPGLLAATALAGATTWTAFKALSALAIVMATVFSFAWAGGRAGPVAGAAVALAALLSHGWRDASRWILSEPVFLAFTFLALWAAERAAEPDRGAEGATPAAGARDGRGAFVGRGSAVAWIAVAGIATALACMTRAAGAPLAVAIVGWLALRRRWLAAGAVASGLAMPGAWWLLRGRAAAEAGSYGSEFWMVNPYEPALGTIGWLDLPGRAWVNLRLYAGTVLPREWWAGLDGGAAILVGASFAALALIGWGIRTRRSPGAAELFAPLYAGMILVWPEVWSGERFLLPLHPLLLLYAGGAIALLAGRFGKAWSVVAPAAAGLVLALPAVPATLAMAADAGECRAVVERSEDVFSCHGDGFRQFREAAVWSAANLPEGSVVLNRKPRIFYVLGGPSGRVFPFVPDADALLAEADRAGARYLLLDQVDGMALYYLPAAIQGRPGAFCHVVGWGDVAGGARTDLFGILPPDARAAGGSVAEIGACPADYTSRTTSTARGAAPTGLDEREPTGLTVPRLARP